MTSIKVKFRPSITKEGEGTLFMQIIHNRLARQVKTSYQILSHEWDEKHSRIRVDQISREREKCLEGAETTISFSIPLRWFPRYLLLNNLSSHALEPSFNNS